MTPRSVELRRQLSEAAMRAENTPESEIKRLATPEVAEKMLAHEQRVVGMIWGLFGGRV